MKAGSIIITFNCQLSSRALDLLQRADHHERMCSRFQCRVLVIGVYGGLELDATRFDPAFNKVYSRQKLTKV